MIIEQLQVGKFAVFAYIVGCKNTGEGIVIDAADEVNRILKTSRDLGIERIKYLVNTHGHSDHCGGNRQLQELTGARIVAHQDDAERMANPPLFILAMFGCEASPPVDETVAEGDEVLFGEQRLQVIHTPGHTPGGICLYTPGYVFTGDTLFVGGIGRTDLPGGSMQVLLRSIRTRLLTLPEETVVLPGHNYGIRPQSTIGAEKRSNPFIL